MARRESFLPPPPGLAWSAERGPGEWRTRRTEDPRAAGERASRSFPASGAAGSPSDEPATALPAPPPPAPPATDEDTLGAAADRARAALSEELQRLRSGIGAEPAPAPEPPPLRRSRSSRGPPEWRRPLPSRSRPHPSLPRRRPWRGQVLPGSASSSTGSSSAWRPASGARSRQAFRRASTRRSASRCAGWSSRCRRPRRRCASSCSGKAEALRNSPAEQERIATEARKAARSEAKRRGRKIQKKVARSVEAANREHAERLARSIEQQLTGGRGGDARAPAPEGRGGPGPLTASAEQARTAFRAEAERSRAAFAGEAEQLAKALAEQERELTERLSAKAVRRDRKHGARRAHRGRRASCSRPASEPSALRPRPRRGSRRAPPRRSPSCAPRESGSAPRRARPARRPGEPRRGGGADPPHRPDEDARGPGADARRSAGGDPQDRRRARPRPELRAAYSVEMLGSAWTLCGHDHQEALGSAGGEAEHPLGLLVLVGGAQLGRVVAEQVLDVEHALGVDLGQLDLRALAEAPLHQLAVDAEGADPDVDAAAGHPGAGPGPDVAEHDGAARGHVLEGEALGVGAVDDAAAAVVDVGLGLAPEHDVGAGEADAEARVGGALDEQPAPLGAVGERLADRAVDPPPAGALALEDRDRAAEHRLADPVLGAALDPDRDPVGVEGAEALARRPSRR